MTALNVNRKRKYSFPRILIIGESKAVPEVPKKKWKSNGSGVMYVSFVLDSTIFRVPYSTWKLRFRLQYCQYGALKRSVH